MPIDAILFDKDGTLYDFQATWSGFARRAIHAFDGVPPEVVAKTIGFDVATGRFHADATFVSETSAVTAARLAEVTGLAADDVRARVDVMAKEARQVPVEGLATTLAALAPRPLGIATNDAEASARAHIQSTGIAHHFEFVAGYDTGHGAKPGAGQLLAFSRKTGIAPDRIAMVGDSGHDLAAAREAGMAAVAVLTGTAPREVLAPMADTVLPDITHLPDWLASL